MLLHSHNQETYANMLRLFQEHNRVAAVQPTGTGKSFLILQLIADNPKKHFLITSPSAYIFTQLITHAEHHHISLENCEFMTYSKLSQTDDVLSNMIADYIITDEFHRLGSPEWGGGIKRLLDTHPDSKVFGTSATPIRYLDSLRNMAEELFDGVYAVNMSLAEAIRKKILPLPVYVTSYYQFSGDVAQLEIRVNKCNNPRQRMILLEKIRKAKTMLTELDCGIEAVFKRHMKRQNGKYILFCANVEKLKQAQEECCNWFADVNRNLHIYSVYSQSTDSKVQFASFRDDQDASALKILLCVNMLNEGIHIDDIDGVIMLRATQSANVFYQQLGRALACSIHCQQPVIFDLVNNFESGDTARQYTEIMKIERHCSSGQNIDIEFEIYDYVRDIRDLLNELNETFHRSWELNFELLSEFVQMNHRFPVNDETYEGVRIAVWVNAQKMLYKNGKLSPERTDALNSLGIQWTLMDNIWYTNYVAAKEYYEQHKSFPSASSIEENEKKIHKWLKHQQDRFREGNLPEEQENLLNAIGYSVRTVSASELWQRKFEALKQYKDENGKFPTSKDAKEKPELTTLCSWMSEQRRKFNQDKLTSKQVSELEQIGFIWDLDAIRWESYFSLLKELVSKTGSVPKQNDKYKGKAIGQWYLKQLKLYEAGALSDTQKTALNSLSIPLTGYRDVQKESDWQSHFSSLKTFILMHHRTPKYGEMVDNYNLYNWIQKQKLLARKGKLTDDKITLFKSIGIDILNFKGFDEDRQPSRQWIQSYEDYKTFLQLHKFPPRSSIASERMLYAWGNAQNQRYRNGKLSDIQIRLLNEIHLLR